MNFEEFKAFILEYKNRISGLSPRNLNDRIFFNEFKSLLSQDYNHFVNPENLRKFIVYLRGFYIIDKEGIDDNEFKKLTSSTHGIAVENHEKDRRGNHRIKKRLNNFDLIFRIFSNNLNCDFTPDFDPTDSEHCNAVNIDKPEGLENYAFQLFTNSSSLKTFHINRSLKRKDNNYSDDDFKKKSRVIYDYGYFRIFFY